jgi:hypothetical protein
VIAGQEIQEGISRVRSRHLTCASREIVHSNGFNLPSSCRKEKARRKN